MFTISPKLHGTAGDKQPKISSPGRDSTTFSVDNLPETSSDLWECEFCDNKQKSLVIKICQKCSIIRLIQSTSD